MKKGFMGGIILGIALLSTPVQASANSLSMSYVSSSEVPIEIQQYAELCGSEYNICPELLESIAYQESRFVPTAENGSCYGLMQVNLACHKDRIKKYGWTEADMSDPYRNMMIASDYLHELFEEYEDVGLVLLYYNGATNAIPEYKRSGKLSKYVNQILERSAEWERLHGK